MDKVCMVRWRRTTKVLMYEYLNQIQQSVTNLAEEDLMVIRCIA